jgi:16S rRNA (adenine1518-N6/adenine1519-N6)-dimethyltransferase
MKRTRPSDIKQLLAERNIQPSRVLGQNFLVDENILHIILDSAHLQPGDAVLEIGPGLGVLTEHLLAASGNLRAIEKDAKLAAYLREHFSHQPGFTLTEADALRLPLADLLAEHHISHVISNLPYSAGTRILMTLIDAPARPLRMVVMLQSDVAERLVAAAGTKAYGLLSIHAQRHYDVCLRKLVSPTCFYPPPEVRSAICELYRRPEPLGEPVDETHFAALIKWCFSQRRKQIGRILTNAPAAVCPHHLTPAQALETAGLTTAQRPESIDIAGWCRLSRVLAPPAAN